MATTTEPGTGTTISFLNKLLGGTPLTHVSIRFWDGTLWPDNRPRAATVVLKHPGALREMLASGTAKGLGEAYLRDDFDVEGDMEQSLELAVALENRPAGWLNSLANFYHFNRLPNAHGGRFDGRELGDLKGRQHTLTRDRQVVSFHYDVSNDFYQLWLDERMVYSCA